MASSTIAATSEAAGGSTQTTAAWASPRAKRKDSTQSHSHKGSSSSNGLSDDNSSNIFHAHRQSHNSSKLPAFRFADLKKKDSLVLPPLLHQHMPPSPVSPSPAQATPDSQQQRDLQAQSQRTLVSSPENIHHNTTKTAFSERRVSPESPPTSAASASAPAPEPAKSTAHSQSEQSQQSSPSRTRASTVQTSSNPSSVTTATTVKRPASFPDSPIANARLNSKKSNTTTTATATAVAKPQPQRAPTTARSSISDGLETPADPTPALKSNRSVETTECAQGAQEHQADNSTKEWANSQRELLHSNKSIDATKSDDKIERRKSRPPVSFRQPGASGRIPPIRSFRSSGSRKSLVLDMHARRTSDDSTYGEDITDPNVRDRTLRALEGRSDDDYSQMTPPDSATVDNDNTAEIFMRIAREDSTRRVLDETGMASAEDQSAASRVIRTSRRRPLSAAVPSYQQSSPPQISRRLSDQRENSRSRHVPDDQPAQQMTRELAYRAIGRDRDRPLPSTESGVEETSRPSSMRAGLRPSPITPRQISFQDAGPDTGSAYSRRRASLTENNGTALSSRASQLRNNSLAYGSGRTYNSSPLVPKSADPHRHEVHHSTETNHGVEGTESSTSTAAPSTVWDELDDLKSRIHRLELTGKMPSSSVAMSRTSDDRPATATTNATTMSASPKRGSGQSAPQVDMLSTTSSQREQQPILLSALTKTKTLVSPEVYSAIETAASDALALTSMMGTAGQPGPISSGASTIGAGGNVTDRQLRKKADSICRSLTELCIALADEPPVMKMPAPALPTPREKEVISPTALKPPASVLSRRPSAVPSESTALKVTTSPRAPTSLEQRRFTMLNSSALPSPRFALAPSTPVESSLAGRKSSLIISRSRRAGTEEPEEAAVNAGRKSSMLLRTRRAGTEEPEDTREREGRKTSLLVRNRRDLAVEEDESRFRAPSRATTEVNGLRSLHREPAQVQMDAGDNTSLASSALPRRSRLIPSLLSSRLAAPSASTTAGNRRFFDKGTAERETTTSSVAEKLAEDRGQRAFSLSQTTLLSRSGSNSRRPPRDSAIPSLSSTGTGTSYR